MADYFSEEVDVEGTGLFLLILEQLSLCVRVFYIGPVQHACNIGICLFRMVFLQLNLRQREKNRTLDPIWFVNLRISQLFKDGSGIFIAVHLNQTSSDPITKLPFQRC